MFEYYGEARGKKLAQDLATTLKPVLTDGHLALARAVGAGEYMVALNNYASLTINAPPTDARGKISRGRLTFLIRPPLTMRS